MSDTEPHNNTNNRRFSFGDFIFDAHRGALSLKGRKIDLNPQPARLLEALLVRAPEIVTRDALQRDLWGDKATVEFEQSLNTCIGQLRVALGESARDPIYIKTEPKIGYRLLPPVTTIEAKTPRHWAIGAALAAGAVILTFVAYQTLQTPADTGLLKAENPTAQDLVLRGRSQREFGDVDAMTESLAHFENALNIAPEEPAALSGAALNIAVLAGSADFPVASSYARANDLAMRSLAINPNAVDARLARGFIALYDRWDIAAARQDFDHARRRAPSYALAHSWSAAALAAEGRVAEAVAASARSVELDPASWYVAADLCWYLIFQEDYPRAANVCAGAVEQKPGLLWSQLGLMEASRGAGKYGDAAKVQNLLADRIGLKLDTAPGASAEENFSRSSCALAEAVAANAKDGSGPNYLIATFYAQCGNFAETTAWLEGAARGGESYVLFYQVDPRFAAYKESEAGRTTSLLIEKRK